MASPMLSVPSPPASASSVGSRKNKFFLPLSHHGMPKTPFLKSPQGSMRSNRFSDEDPERSPKPMSAAHPPMSPMSPPMSAKSFGTFIDSEPSTPAYSPQMGSEWDNSTLMLLSPVSTAPSSPPEPRWNGVLSQPPKRTSRLAKPTPTLVKQISSQTPLSSHPPTVVEKRNSEEAQKENLPPSEKESPAESGAEKKAKVEEPTHAATLEKLATKVKTLLRRKNTSEKKNERRRERRFQELDRMETVHWTEM